MLRVLEEYWKHSVLNFAQALHGIRHLFSHPDFDAVAPRGSWRHARLSAGLRSKRLVNDFFFALIPPHWHHTREELAGMAKVPAIRWFQYGYSVWRFNEDGSFHDYGNALPDKRWDPRCKNERF
jgi:hypothetical protein